jgi:predicted nucleic acid-binding protein
MKIYCDTSSLFSNADRHKKDSKAQREATAISRLLGLHRQGNVQLVRSDVVRRELEKTSDVTQRDALFNDFLQIVPVANEHKALGVDEQTTDPFGGFATSPLVSDVQDEGLVETLQKQFSLEKFDAQHLAQALSNSANIFLTRDERHFLKQRKRQAIEKDFNIKIRLPSEV